MTRRTRVDHYHHRGNGCLWIFLAAFLIGLFDRYPIPGLIVLTVTIGIASALYLRR